MPLRREVHCFATLHQLTANMVRMLITGLCHGIIIAVHLKRWISEHISVRHVSVTMKCSQPLPHLLTHRCITMVVTIPNAAKAVASGKPIGY